MLRALPPSRAASDAGPDRLLDATNLLRKRVFDVLVAGPLAVFAAPVLAAIAAAIRLDSPGPAIFVQERVGRGGRAFRCLKFRTMFVGGEPRVTRVGRLLRSTHLDELPQLLNVLAGDMSLVGPRPLTADRYDGLGEPDRSGYREVRPGLTGLGELSEGERGSEDSGALTSRYVRIWSLALDAIVVWRTVRRVAMGLRPR